MKKILEVTLLLAAILLHGCLTPESKEYRFKINPDGSGEGVIKFINIVSEEDDGKDVSFKDFGELISDYLEGTTFEDDNPNYIVTGKKLFEENGTLCGEVTFTFDSIEDAGFYKDESCECSSTFYYLGSLSETFESTSGAYLGNDEKDFPMIKWENGVSDFSFKTNLKEDLSDAHSLLPLYKTWQANK